MGQGRPGRWWLRLAATSLLVTSAVGFIACSDDDKESSADTTPAATQPATQEASADAAAVEAAMQATFDNWNAKDLEVFIAGFTDAGLVSVFGEDGQTVDELKVGLANFIGSDLISDVTIANTQASGTTATTEAQFAIGGAFDKNAYSFVKVGDAWKVNSETRLAVDVPAGTKLVHIDANEFAYGVDISEIGDGNVAFEFANVGTQPHELVLFRVPADLLVEDLVQQIAESEDGEVPGVEFAGAVSAEPNETFNLVLTEPLASGRYLMVCFLPNLDEGEEGTAHALKGMTKEFTIELTD